MNVTRIRKELAECSKDVETSGITAVSVDGSLSHLTGTLKGPVGTPYEGGVFTVDIHVPPTYVFWACKVGLPADTWFQIPLRAAENEVHNSYLASEHQ